jgi:hypothetical protein
MENGEPSVTKPVSGKKMVTPVATETEKQSRQDVGGTPALPKQPVALVKKKPVQNAAEPAATPTGRER